MDDKGWHKKIEKAAARHLPKGNVIAVEKALVAGRQGVRLIAKDPGRLDRKDLAPIDGLPVSVLPVEAMLSAADLQAHLEAQGWIDWHPRYERERWRDKDGPLRLVNVWKMPGERQETWMIMYKCQDPQCRGCRHPTSPAGQFHHKLIRPDGMDSVGRCEEIQLGKKRSESILVDQPVFTGVGCTPGATS